jgi:two-component system response regulator YesN
MMYKVLIVDDEIFVRKGVINLIDWSSLQFEICAEAENGQQAIKLIEQHRPDLVLVDIRMPVMDGLELIRHVKEEGEYQPLFIVVSGYNDFSYAQQALRYNVSDYMVKPVDERELAATLKKLANSLNQMKLSSITREKPLVETVIESLLQAEPNDQVIQQIAHVLELPRSSSYTYVIAELQGMPLPEDKDHLLALKSTLERFFQHERTLLLIHERAYSQYGFVVPQVWLTEHASTERAAYAKLLDRLEEELGTTVVLFIGSSANDLKGIVNSGSAANECLNYRFAAGSKRLVLASEMLALPLYYFDVDEGLHSKLIYEIEANRYEGYASVIDTIFTSFQDMRFAPSAVTNTIRRSVIALINILRQLEGDEQELQLLDELLEWHKKYRNLEQLHHVFLRFVEEAAAYIADRRSKSGKGSIEKVKIYIDSHYKDNIYLKGIAAMFYMNPVYLGQLFRKNYGVYFNEYLLSLRIEEAKRLLRQTKKRMYEIAELVGFQNADYFATQFEKLEKMTPTDYRNQMIGKK